MYKKRKIKSRIYFVLTMILILLLILFFANYGKIVALMQMGNIDIFDIIISDCEKNGTCDDKVLGDTDINDSNSNTNSNTNSNSNKLSVYDERGDYRYQKKINIFSNPDFGMKQIIAPGSSNIYRFFIKNSNKFDIQYSIKMSEENEYNINIKYRLKQDEEYIIGNDDTWVTANELIVEKAELSSKSIVPYVLEWKWFDTDYDTEIGKKATSKYKLSINVVANAV